MNAVEDEPAYQQKNILIKMPTEQEILNLIRKITPDSKKYLHDDAAIIENNLVLTTDTLVENTHFTLKSYKPEEIGWKAFAINLSDIAAMGANPFYALISLSLPKTINQAWIKGFYKGLNLCAKKYKTKIIGGNLTRSKEINITITVIGKIEAGFKSACTRPALRSNAKPGDLVFATGTFGDSACGLIILQNNKKLILNPKSLILAHKKPIPQIETGKRIAELCKRAALMDASDGLADCLIQLSNKSGVKIILDRDKIPLSKNATAIAKKLKKDIINLALYGGEDYQLVGTASLADIKKIKKIKGINVIGKVLKGKGAFLKQINGTLVKLDMKKSYAHFK